MRIGGGRSGEEVVEENFGRTLEESLDTQHFTLSTPTHAYAYAYEPIEQYRPGLTCFVSDLINDTRLRHTHRLIIERKFDIDSRVAFLRFRLL